MSDTFFANGKKLILGPLLGKGGEGAVYNISGSSDTAVKIYNDGKAPERHEKIVAMVAAGLSGTSAYVAYPLEVVTRQNGKFAGFTMKKAAGFKTVHDLYGPGSRRAEISDRRRPLPRPRRVQPVRRDSQYPQVGCVVGDINHSGILVSSQALVTLIDSDSFQFRSNSRTYRSLVGVAEYTPAELQGVSFERTDRTTNHDAFGLAVLLFQLLFLGRHHTLAATLAAVTWTSRRPFRRGALPTARGVPKHEWNRLHMSRPWMILATRSEMHSNLHSPAELNWVTAAFASRLGRRHRPPADQSGYVRN